jgi:hypothetical protein
VTSSAVPGLRLLLDQNFPQPVIDLSTVDATVTVVSLDTFDRTLTKRGTPDWLIYLRARQGGFNGVVTRDRSQLDDPEELVALIDAGMNVITWRHPVEDPIQEWGQLLAYMGLIRKRLDGQEGIVIQLPRPSLNTNQVATARNLLGQLASVRSTSFPEMRDNARDLMRSELNERGLTDLLSLVGPP